jgi:hypothetical protein
MEAEARAQAKKQRELDAKPVETEDVDQDEVR